MLPVLETPGLTAASGAEARTGLSVLMFILLFVFAVAFIFAIALVSRQTIARKRQTTLKQDYRKEAEDYERSGKFVSAAALYENQLKNKRKAAELYEKGGDYRQAAFLYDLLGMSGKAREMYLKDGDVESAAEASVLEGDYEEAAKLYHSAGKKIDAALLLEKAGRKMAAARIYREAGEYKKASRLLEEEGLLKEAAEMFGISLRDKTPAEYVDDFYAYALKLERAGEQQTAIEVFRTIERVDPRYRDVREKLEILAPPPPAEESDGTRTTLRNFIRSGKFEPRHALKLWLHILKALQEAYGQGRSFGPFSPDTIAIDTHNTISFLPGTVSPVYASPESLGGSDPDSCSDIFSAGIILYEMLMGNLDGLGSARIIDSVEDAPDWLDEIVLRCIRKVREDRYQSIERIFSDIKDLSSKKKTIDR
jgi:tetratricopeptide (TPR) repeat protein